MINMLNKKSPKAGFGRLQLLVLILAIAMGVILVIPFYNSYVACMESESCKPSGSACQKVQLRNLTVTKAKASRGIARPL